MMCIMYFGTIYTERNAKSNMGTIEGEQKQCK